LTPNPILKVLSTLTLHQVQCLLMGGQACVFYGGAEFSRDTDLAVLAEPENLDRLAVALGQLDAKCIAVPPFTRDYLQRGHAIPFRCRHPEALGMRVDVMALMRGIAPFAELWARRTTLEIEGGARIELLSLPDLVKAKKTQRDKDWPMIRRLVEASYFQNQQHPNPEQVHFWLAESRTPAMLLELARRYPGPAGVAVQLRPLLALTISGDETALASALETEEKRERDADRAYWVPLRSELEQLRQQRRQQQDS
jgi:hypothetical protein